MLWFFRGNVNLSRILWNTQTEANVPDSQESQGSVNLDTRSPTLVERMLQFLYTGDYTVEDNTTKVQISPSDSDKIPELDTWHSEAALRLSQRDQNDVENLSAEEHAVDQIAMSLSNQLAASLTDECSVNKKTSVADEGPLTGSSEQMDAIDESLADCHPCYFHLRMYGEADYFLIKDLKTKAAENFRDSFENCSEKQILALVIKELYSTNADYRDIRKSVIELIVKNLRKLHGGLTPGIDYDLLTAYPEFAAELCIATMEKYLSVLSSLRQALPLSAVEYKTFEFKNFEYPWGIGEHGESGESGAE